MKTLTSKLNIISICCFVFISCGDSGDLNVDNTNNNITNNTTNNINSQNEKTVYKKNDTLSVHKGDSIKSLSLDTKINIITDTESGTSKITILSGSILLINAN